MSGMKLKDFNTYLFETKVPKDSTITSSYEFYEGGMTNSNEREKLLCRRRKDSDVIMLLEKQGLLLEKYFGIEAMITPSFAGCDGKGHVYIDYKITDNAFKIAKRWGTLTEKATVTDEQGGKIKVLHTTYTFKITKVSKFLKHYNAMLKEYFKDCMKFDIMPSDANLLRLNGCKNSYGLRGATSSYWNLTLDD